MSRTRIFRGPPELARVWHEMAAKCGAGTADHVLAHDLDTTPARIACRRRSGMWQGVDWMPAIRAHRESAEAAER